MVLAWTGVHCGLQNNLGYCEVNGNGIRTPDSYKLVINFFNPQLRKSKDFYAILILNKVTQSRGFSKLKSKFSFDDAEVKKAFSLCKSAMGVSMLNDITSTNSCLAKIG